MKLKNLAILGAVCTSLVFAACKKDDDNKKEEPAYASIVGTWKKTTELRTVNYGGRDTIIDYFSDIDSCDKDDLIRFNTDKTMTYFPGAIKCSPSDPDSSQGGRWAMSSDNKKLSITDGFSVIFDVVTLNSNTLKLQLSLSDNGTTSIANMIFIKQ